MLPLRIIAAFRLKSEELRSFAIPKLPSKDINRGKRDI